MKKRTRLGETKPVLYLGSIVPIRKFFDPLFFDGRDYELLTLVNDVLSRDEDPGLKRLLAPSMHPHGIKEMASSRGLRIAYAVIDLFRSLERGLAADRIRSLRALRDEALYSSHTSLRRNTARVLLQIMKELVRAEDELEQLKLAHNFREAAFGKPRIVSRELAKYHLVEMPEEWNQVAFDDHVHDANTKGRKSATHLIMDAWIKGIRRLKVIYYNHVQPEVAEELLEAASIMGVTVRIGIEFHTPFRGKYVRIIWTPRGFTDSIDFMEFLHQPEMQTLMAEGQQASRYQQAYVFSALQEFNATHRKSLNERFAIAMEPLTVEEFNHLVGTGQPSLHHLSKLIQDRILPHLQQRTREIQEQAQNASGEELTRYKALVSEMNRLDIDSILENYLRPEKNPSLHNPYVPHPDAPPLLQLKTDELLTRLEKVHTGFRTTLNLSNLLVEDVLEILYDTGGHITHLEIFNIKDFAFGHSTDNARILQLQSALNSGNAVRLKRTVRAIIDAVDDSRPEAEQVRENLLTILCDLSTLRNFYRRTRLQSRLGTDSTGNSPRIPGMGLVLTDSVSRKARRHLERNKKFPIPLSILADKSRTYFNSSRRPSRETDIACRAGQKTGLAFWSKDYEEQWIIREYYEDDPDRSNIRTLGGTLPHGGNGLTIEAAPEKKSRLPHPRYLNSYLKNGLKILLGFIPAFLTFYLTKDWWVLAYLGAFLWFGITGVRNIIQSVLGAGGIRRSPMLQWNEYVSWSRFSDSLLYTGFSVPLLDYLVKTLLMEKGFGITASSSPVLLYTVMALVNGTYITSHNLFRGLPKAAAFGNFFRSILSIPVALAVNALLGGILGSAGVAGVDSILQRWAAIISKFSSDSVAGVIEGLADRRQNICMRIWDFQGKLKVLYETYARLELLYPRNNVVRMLESPTKFFRTIGREDEELEHLLIINALDLLYFWMYQPRARVVLKRFMRNMTTEERRVFLLSQYVLQREREISQLFLDGLVGKNFAKPLAFYLSQAPKYLDDLHKMAIKDAPSDFHTPEPRLQDEDVPCFSSQERIRESRSN